MRMTLDLSEDLLKKAMTLSKAPTKRATVVRALEIAIEQARVHERIKKEGFSKVTGLKVKQYSLPSRKAI